MIQRVKDTDRGVGGCLLSVYSKRRCAVKVVLDGSPRAGLGASESGRSYSEETESVMVHGAGGGPRACHGCPVGYKGAAPDAARYSNAERH